MHNNHRLVNFFQTPAERRYKYKVMRMAGHCATDATRFKDWNWRNLWGLISTGTAPDVDKAAILELIADGYESFKGIEKEPRYKPMNFRERR